MVESSFDMRTWADYSRGYLTNDTISILVTNTHAAPMRFFRARQISNDYFANRYPILGFPVSVYGTDVGATSEPGEPPLGFGQTVWWTWTAPVSGTVGIGFAGTWLFEVYIGIFTGSTINNLVPVGFNYVHGGIVFTAKAGTTYQFQLGPGEAFPYESPPGQGPLIFNLTPAPPNDNFSDRILLSGTNVLTNACSLLATTEPFETNGYLASIWWSWTAPTNGTMRVSGQRETYNSSGMCCFTDKYSGHTDVYTGETTNLLVAVPIYNANCFDVSAGATYQIVQNSLFWGGNDTLALQFASGRYFVLATANSTAEGVVSLSPAADNDGMYAQGTVVTIAAQPASGYRFLGWAGSITSSVPVLQITVDHSFLLQANFGP